MAHDTFSAQANLNKYKLPIQYLKARPDYWNVTVCVT